MQGNQTKNDVRPPLAVLNYTLDKACLSYQGEHCSPIDLCQHALIEKSISHVGGLRVP